MRITVRSVLPLIITCLLSGAMTSNAQTPPQRAITAISGNLYRVQNDRHNSLVLVTPDGIILTDPINRDFASWLKAELTRRFDRPVKYVIYSHHHWDHASGGGVFSDTAQFIGHENMLARLRLPAPDTPLSHQEARLDANDNSKIELVEANDRLKRLFSLIDANADGVLDGAEIARGPVSDVYAPSITYRDRMTVSLGGSTVELTWAGPITHGDDMTVIRFPADGVVYVVDFIQIRSLPYGTLGEGYLDEWLESIVKVESMDFTIVAPGHDGLGTKSDIADFRQYLEDLRSAVAAGSRAGKSIEALQQEVRMDKYQQWAHYEARRADNVAGMHKLLSNEPRSASSSK